MVTLLPALACSRAAIRPAAPAPITTMWLGCGLAIAWLSSRFGGRIRILDPVAQEHCAALQCPAALERHCRDRRAPVSASGESKTLGAPFSPSPAEQRIR